MVMYEYRSMTYQEYAMHYRGLLANIYRFLEIQGEGRRISGDGAARTKDPDRMCRELIITQILLNIKS